MRRETPSASSPLEPPVDLSRQIFRGRHQFFEDRADLGIQVLLVERFDHLLLHQPVQRARIQSAARAICPPARAR